MLIGAGFFGRWDLCGIEWLHGSLPSTASKARVRQSCPLVGVASEINARSKINIITWRSNLVGLCRRWSGRRAVPSESLNKALQPVHIDVHHRRGKQREHLAQD